VTPRGARVVRGGLLVVLVAVSGMVALSLRRPARKPAAAASPSPSPLTDPSGQGTRLGGFVHRTVKTDKDGSVRESVVVRAQAYEGKDQEEQRLKGVEVSLTYTAQGKPGHATITADDGVYNPILQKAIFTGHVHVLTEDGMELWTEQLIHRGDKNVVRSDQLTRFKRKDLSGTANGFTYDSEAGRLELLKDVDLKIQDEDNPATLIRSASAEATKEDGLLKFLGGVEVTQGSDRLKSQRLVVNFAAEDRVIHRAQALDDVQLWTSGATQVPGMTAATTGSGSRYLQCRRLDLWFRPDRTMQQAVAGPNADLTMMPGPKDPPEKKRLRSDVLDFVFDDKGRLEGLTALKDTTFTTEPIPPAKAVPRALECKRFVARIDPLTGEATTIEFVKDVAFSRGAQRATSQRALYDGKKQTLALSEDPVVVDEQQGTELRAEDIDMATELGDVHAREAVRHILRGRSAVRAGLLGSQDDPTLITAGQFDYVAATKVAAYQHDVLLRSGKDEIRSGALTIREEGSGKRRLEARDRVLSRMQPKATTAGAVPATLEARAGEMNYDEAANRIEYKGDVFIRQGDIQTKSPAATVSLNPDGGSIKTLEAGDPVEVQQAARRAKGSKGTYTPSTETMVLVGDNVMLTDATGQVQGRSLTFHVGDERVLVDGREEVRTQMIIKQEPRQN
jgi:lipopolysaccharide transport protein LptA/LPS export ABC transporter protein LptC